MNMFKKILLLIIPVFILTGCGSTLKCEIDTSNYESTIKIKFKDDKPTTYKYKDALDFGNSLNTDSEFDYNEKQTRYGTLISEKYAKVSEFQSVVKVKIDYDFSKNNSSGENALLISRDDTLSSAKTKIESSGYSCK